MTPTEGRTMPKVTLYIKDSYAEVWDRARKLTDNSDESLSTLVSEALSAAVDAREAANKREQEERDTVEELKVSMEPIQFEVEQPRRQTVRFTGVLLGSTGQAPLNPDEAIYLTKGGNFVLYICERDEGSFEKYDSIEEIRELQESGRLRISEEVLAEAFEALGKPFVVEIN